MRSVYLQQSYLILLLYEVIYKSKGRYHIQSDRVVHKDICLTVHNFVCI